MKLWPFKSRRRTVPPRAILARYESAAAEHHALWPLSDGYSADAAASPEVRKVLRERCRNQAEIDPVCEGLIDTVANDLIGAGPRLQVLLDDEPANDQIENAFNAWARAIHLPEKLRTMRRARATDGEAFGIFTSNPGNAHPVTLDIKIIEADQVTSPDLFQFESNAIDGIEFDQAGNPSTYTILRDHPGDVHRTGVGIEFDHVPAAAVLHYFKGKRPQQHRGIPDLAPALLHFAYLRRFVLATVVAAETAANNAMVIQTDAPADGEAQSVDPLETIELDRGRATTLPQGWQLGQQKAEHPTTHYQMFRREMIGDIARCLQLPLNIALLNSSGFNFASGRLDYLVYHTSLRVDRGHLEARILDRIFRAFLQEAVLVSDLLPLQVRTLIATGGEIAHQWNWPGHEHAVDPAKEAAGATERLNNRTSTLAREYARQGLDWKEELHQIAAEKRLMDELELTPAEASAAVAGKPDPEEPDDEE